MMNVVIKINNQKNLTFYQEKCEEVLKEKEVVELHAIGNATGMLIKVCEGLARVHGRKMIRLESLGFYDRKQLKKRKVKLVAIVGKGEFKEKNQ